MASLDEFLIMMLLLLVHFYTFKLPSVSIKVQLASKSVMENYMPFISPQKLSNYFTEKLCLKSPKCRPSFATIELVKHFQTLMKNVIYILSDLVLKVQSPIAR